LNAAQPAQSPCDSPEGGRWSTQWAFPNKRFPQPLLRLHFLAYLLGNYIAAIQAEQAHPKGAAKPGFSKKQKRRIALEAGFIVLFQLFIYLATGAEGWAYFWAGPVSYLFTIAILMAYIFTNHTIHSVNASRQTDDPLLTTISVGVHPVLNKLHFHFAYHTEHHLFPSLNSDYYPLISKVLKEKYPEKYKFMPLEKAWAELWQKYKEELGRRQ
jgi:fatty acid desaturase